jgi:hypothetical protein
MSRDGADLRRLLASRPVYMSPDEARSDVILAAAAAVFGSILIGLISGLPLYPRTGLLGAAVAIFWIFALTGLVPLLLAKYRGDGVQAFGLDGPRDQWRRGLVLALPVVALGVLNEFVATGGLGPSLLGRIGGATGGTPSLAPLGLPGPVAMVLASVELLALVLGGLLLTTFLAVRGREGFRPVDLSLTQAVRTFGMGCAGVALVTGGLRSLGPDVRIASVLLQVATLVALVLLADRLVPLGPTVPRGAVLAPLVVIAVAHVFTVGGGLLFGNPLIGLHNASLGAGTAVVIAAMVAARRMAWAAVPLVVALHWWPSCLSPVAFERAVGC